MRARGVLAGSAALVAAALVARWTCAPAASVPVAAAPVPASIGAPAAAVEELREPALAPAAPVDSAPAPAAADDPAEPPTPDVVEFVEASQLPADPPETGPASLTLRLVDRRTGEPLASRVALWRVDAPANEAWSAGDQLQATVEVPEEGVRLADLPEGRFRADCACATASRELPELELRAPHTVVELALELPQEFELRLHFVDRFGEAYASAQCWQQSLHSVEPPPAARSRRELRSADGVAWSSAASLGFGGRSAPQELVQTADGMGLGRHRACSRERGMRPVLRLRAPDGALAEVEVPAHGEGVVRMVAVGLPPDVAAARVRLPDGRASAAAVEALGLAQPCSDPAREWRAAPVRVKAELAGFASVEMPWRAADGELPWILLQPADAAGGE